MHNPSSGAWTDMIWAGNRLLAEVAGTQTAVPAYRLLDQVGSLAATTDGSGNVTGTDVLTPYGQVVSSTVSDLNLYTGLPQDTENGSDHASYRNYATAQTRWLAPDPYNGSYDLTNPQSFNRYTYVNNNPLAFVDPSGLILCDMGAEGFVDAASPETCLKRGGTLPTVDTTVTVTATPTSAPDPGLSYPSVLLGGVGIGSVGVDGNSNGTSNGSRTNKILQCASKLANQFSIAGVLGITGAGGGLGSTIGTAFLGNTFSGIVDTDTHIYNNAKYGGNGNQVMGDLILGGARQGIPRSCWTCYRDSGGCCC